MGKIRYDILIRTSSKGVRKEDFIWNRQPHRPGSIVESFDEAVQDQYQHLGFGLRLNGTTKYMVKGIRWVGAGLDGTDIVWMWCPQVGTAVVMKVVRHG